MDNASETQTKANIVFCDYECGFRLEIARKQGLHRDYGMQFVRDGLRCINLHGACCENIAKTLFCVKSMVLFS